MTISDKIRWTVVLVIAAMLTIAEPLKAQDQLDAILEGVEKRYAGGGFTATFIQETSVPDMNVTDVASGKLMMKRPAKMRWVYEKPDNHIIVSDGERLWIYRPDDNQVMMGSAPKFFGREQGAVFLTDMSQIRNIFDISLVESSQDLYYVLRCQDLYYVLRLVPVKKMSGVTEIFLSIIRNGFQIFEIRTRAEGGNDTRIELIDLQLNADLDDALFSFEIPPGADVVQLGE
jgi:outer membrane lipoprotein carrier protein